MVEIAVDGRRWRRGENLFPINDQDQKSCILQESKEAEANRWRGWEREDTTTHAQRISKATGTKRRIRRSKRLLFCFRLIFVYINLWYFSPMFRAANITKGKTQIKLNNLQWSWIMKSWRQNVWICQLLSRDFSTFNGLDIRKPGLQLLEFSLHQKLRPFHVEPACHRSTLTIARVFIRKGRKKDEKKHMYYVQTSILLDWCVASTYLFLYKPRPTNPRWKS